MKGDTIFQGRNDSKRVKIHGFFFFKSSPEPSDHIQSNLVQIIPKGNSTLLK
jgi:hypothetical protein